MDLMQLPGKPTYIRGTAPNDTGEKMGIRIGTYGKGSCDAEGTGPEFNPLTEINKYGQANPFQDPSRGRFGTCVTDDTGVDNTGVCSWAMYDLE